MDLPDPTEPDVYQFVRNTADDTLGQQSKSLWSSRMQVLGETVKTTNECDKVPQW